MSPSEPIAKPFTPAQRRLFHAAEEDEGVAEQHGMSHGTAGKLADEADDLARQGKERKSIKANSFIDLSDLFR